MGHRHGATAGASPKREREERERERERERRGLPVVTGTTKRTCGTPERHRLFSVHEKRTSRDLGAAPPCQKQALPASEVVRDPMEPPARQKGRGAHGPCRCGAAGCANRWCDALRHRILACVSVSTCFFVSFLWRMAPLNSLATFTPVMGCPVHCGTLFWKEKVTVSQAGYDSSL